MATYSKELRQKNSAGWIKNLNKYVVPAATDKDCAATIRNNGGDAKTTARAAYVPLAKGEDD